MLMCHYGIIPIEVVINAVNTSIIGVCIHTHHAYQYD